MLSGMDQRHRPREGIMGLPDEWTGRAGICFSSRGCRPISAAASQSWRQRRRKGWLASEPRVWLVPHFHVPIDELHELFCHNSSFL
jgi:hypothetical protein